MARLADQPTGKHGSTLLLVQARGENSALMRKSELVAETRYGFAQFSLCNLRTGSDRSIGVECERQFVLSKDTKEVIEMHEGRPLGGDTIGTKMQVCFGPSDKESGGNIDFGGHEIAPICRPFYTPLRSLSRHT